MFSPNYIGRGDGCVYKHKRPGRNREGRNPLAGFAVSLHPVQIDSKDALMARAPVIEFWYEFASTYSYLSAMRLEEAAREAGVVVRVAPVSCSGRSFPRRAGTPRRSISTPAKGRYMWRDMAREAARIGLPLVKPAPFPQNSLTATRVALLGADEPWGPQFTRAVYRTEFGEGRSIEEPLRPCAPFWRPAASIRM